MFGTVRVGQRLPSVRLAKVANDNLETMETDNLFAGKRAVIIGVPGAFTPVCTEKHIPQFVKAADSLKAAGFDMIAVVAPNDPWVMEKMAEQMDPDHKLVFLSDGNLDFIRATGLVSDERQHFMGERSQRYLMTLRNAIVERLNVEQTVLSVSCTSVKDVVEI